MSESATEARIRDLQRQRKRAGVTSRSILEDLTSLGWHLDYRQSSRIALTLEALIGELAALVELTDGNRSVPTDKGAREGRGGVLAHEMPMPDFNSSAAYRQLYDSEKRLWQEYEKLAGVVRKPSKTPKPKCGSCDRRERVVDTFCGPCAAGILKQYRRKESPRDGEASGGTEPT